MPKMDNGEKDIRPVSLSSKHTALVAPDYRALRRRRRRSLSPLLPSQLFLSSPPSAVILGVGYLYHVIAVKVNLGSARSLCRRCFSRAMAACRMVSVRRKIPSQLLTRDWCLVASRPDSVLFRSQTEWLVEY